MVIKDVEREEIEFLSKSLNCKPISDPEFFTEDRLGVADLIEEIDSDGSKIVKITGVKSNVAKPTVSVIVRGANNVILDETERSLHDALCVIRCLVKERALIAGGGAPEIEASFSYTHEGGKSFARCRSICVARICCCTRGHSNYTG